MPLNRWSSVSTASRTVATTSGWAWPRIALIWPEVKSRMARPALVVDEGAGGPFDHAGTNVPP